MTNIVNCTIVDKDTEDTISPYEEIKKAKFRSQMNAIDQFQKLAKSKSFKHSWVLLLHRSEDFRDDETLMEAAINKSGSVSSSYVRNPMFRFKKRPTRNKRMMHGMNKLPGRHAQLLAMLDMSGRDLGLLGEFKLDDKQQNPVYEFHDNNWQKGETNALTVHECSMLMRNVLTYAGLPWIQLNFIEEGDTCFFRVQTDVKIPKSAGTPRAAIKDDDHLEDISPNRTPTISLEGLSLNLLVTWGTQADIVLHELAHYITFMTPIPERFTNLAKEMRQEDYALLFSGHGILYCTVLFHLLHKFCYYEKPWLRTQAAMLKFEFDDVDDLRPETLGEVIKARIYTTFSK